MNSNNVKSTIIRQRHNTAAKKTENEDKLSAELRKADGDRYDDCSMFENSFMEYEHLNRLSSSNNFSTKQSILENFNTYPPKRNTTKLKAEKTQEAKTANAAAAATMSVRNSPLKVNNSSSAGKYYRKHISKRRSLSESSAAEEKKQQQHYLHKYSSSDSDSSSLEQLLLNSSSVAPGATGSMDRRSRIITKRSLSTNHLQVQHKQQSRDNRTQTNNAVDLIFCNVFGKRAQHISDMVDIAIRVVLVIVFSKLETQPAFKRIIHEEEMWMYKNPRTKDYVSPLALLLAIILGPFAITLLHLLLTKDRRDFRAASWAWTLCLGLNGLATSLLKISVGRPRPDYFYRCFPDGVMQLTSNATLNSSAYNNMLDLFNCTGSLHDINEGRKSFPSGHSSFAFAGFGFITYYVGAKLHAFNHRGRGETWRLFISATPLVLAALVAVSRTCDYHHHWQDVVVGSLIGLFVSYYVYRQYYPSIFSQFCHRPYPRGIYKINAFHKNSNSTTSSSHSPYYRKHMQQSYKRLASEDHAAAAAAVAGTTEESQLLREAQGEFQQQKFPMDSDKSPLIEDSQKSDKWF